MLPKYLLLSCIFLLGVMNSFAQPTIALQHDGTSTFFTDIPSAVNAAVSGDTIYLPGGNFPGFSIDKSLAIIGAGHDPDSTVATNRTVISGAIEFSNGDCDGTIFTGLRVNGSVNNLSTAYINNNIQIMRCFLFGIYAAGYSENWTMAECFIFGQITLVSNSIISNNLLTSFINNATNCQIENNIFLYNNENNIPPIIGDLCSVKNNIFKIFTSSVNGNMISNSTFNNNIFGSGYLENGLFGNGNFGTGNIYHTDFDGLFTTFSYTTYAGNSNNLYQSDFHLTVPAYNTGGTGGTPIGIYGGLFPWKEGSVPFNPHIQAKQIVPTTDPAGNLNINIQVQAQDH